MSSRRKIFLGLVVLTAFFLQVAVMPQFKLFGCQPDLMLVIAVVIAVTDGPVEGAIVGFCGGLLLDIASPQVMGVGAFSRAVAAFLAGMMKDFFMTYTILLPVLLVFIMSLLEPSIHQATLAMLGQEQLPPFNVVVLFAAALYNVLTVFVLYPILRRFRFPVKEESLVLSKPGGK